MKYASVEFIFLNLAMLFLFVEFNLSDKSLSLHNLKFLFVSLKYVHDQNPSEYFVISIERQKNLNQIKCMLRDYKG